jgi:hypothetical protein
VRRREQQRDVHGNARRDQVFDRAQPGGRAGDLDEDVRAVGLREQCEAGRHGGARVVDEIRCDLDRNEPVGSVTRVEDRAEQIGCGHEVLQCDSEDEVLGRLDIGSQRGGDRRVVVAATGDRVFEDRRVRCHTGDIQVVYVVRQRPGADEVFGDVVEPQALAGVVERLECVHEWLPFDDLELRERALRA